MADENYASTVLKRIYESEFPSDKVSLTSGKDDQKFPIHIVVLTAVSKYFAASLGPNFQDGEKDEFILEGTDAETVKAIVDYCYTGEIHLTEENVGKFLVIASSVQLDLLETKCRRFYEDILGVSNCVDAFMVADKLSYVVMRQKALDIISGSFNQVSTAEIQKLDHQLVEVLLKCDEVRAPEKLIFERLLEWYQFNETDRGPHMPELLKFIRLDLITAEFLSETLEVVYKKFDCSEPLFDEYKRRALTQCSNIDGYRFGSSFCLFLQFKGERGADKSAVKIEKFNPVLNSFDEAGEITLGDWTNFGVVMLRNKILVLGGQLNKQYLDSVSAFDLNTGEEEILPGMNSAREAFVPISRGKYIYVFGGRNYNGPLKTCERFDTETKTWTVMKDMGIARYNHCITQMDEYICVAGGFSNNQDSNFVELYDPTKDEWTQLASMQEIQKVFTMIDSNESLYAMGYKHKAVIERYDHRHNSWTKVGSFENSEHIASASDIGGKIFAIMKNGEFGRITINGSGELSFVRLGQSKYESKYRGRHWLCQN